jgi:hypothetical protein
VVGLPAGGERIISTWSPFGIHNRGEIAGGYVDVDGGVHAFLCGRDGEFTPIDVPDAVFTIAFNLNDPRSDGRHLRRRRRHWRDVVLRCGARPPPGVPP